MLCTASQPSSLWSALEAEGVFDTLLISPEHRVSLERRFDISTDTLLRQVVGLVKQFAVAPISSFDVGAAGLGESGAVYLGTNLEFAGAAISETVHGEQFMLTNAVHRNETRIQAVAVNAAPCGHCRQFLNELPSAGEIVVLIGEAPAQTLGELLPHPFGPADLGCDTPLLTRFDHGLQTTSQDSCVRDAVSAANRSYAPYTASYSGVAISHSGTNFCGSYIESAAYNPSLPPMQAALVALRAGGVVDFSGIDKVVLVECEGAPVRHHTSTSTILDELAPRARLENVVLPQ